MTPLCIEYTWTFCTNIQRLAAGSRFPPGNPVSPTNKSDRHDIAEILLKMASESHPHPLPQVIGIKLPVEQ
jgi:hypothetical protein